MIRIIMMVMMFSAVDLDEVQWLMLIFFCMDQIRCAGACRLTRVIKGP